MHFLASLLTTTTLLSSALAVPVDGLRSRTDSSIGTLTINSKCENNAYLQVVTQVPGPTETILPGQSWSQQFQTTEIGGVAVKLAAQPSFGSTGTLQMEYTISTDANKNSYDMSLINGDGGMGSTFLLTPENLPDPLGSSCQIVGARNSYWFTGDEGNSSTKTCTMGNSMTLDLC